MVRQQYAKDHHNTATFFPKAKTEYNNGKFTPGGALKTVNLAAGGEMRLERSLELFEEGSTFLRTGNSGEPVVLTLSCGKPGALLENELRDVSNATLANDS